MAEETITRVQQLAANPLFAGVPPEELEQLLTEFSVQHFSSGEVLLQEGDKVTRLIALLSGEVRAHKQGNELFAGLTHYQGVMPIFVGDVGLLTEEPCPFQVVLLSAAEGLVLEKEDFWGAMARYPGFRSVILHSVTERMNAHREVDVREQKLASLGILTAGLMHELNNPGSAAGRAAKQLRENLNRMHDLAKEFSQKEEHHTPEQSRCFWEMQERVLGRQRVDYMNSLEQADAEEHLTEWLEQNHVSEPWLIAPTFAASGITGEELDCLKSNIGNDISHELVWMAQMVGGMQMVDTIEESIARIASLVKAVKIYTHEGQGKSEINLNESIFSTIVILKYKMHERNIRLKKDFASDLPLLKAQKSSLNQVWTNLLDNAIDAAGNEGEISVRTWHQGAELFVEIGDNGPGIPPEQQSKIFDPFFTTKPAGVGTGLGLGIAYQIVREYGGEVRFESSSKGTIFQVQLPQAKG